MAADRSEITKENSVNVVAFLDDNPTNIGSVLRTLGHLLPAGWAALSVPLKRRVEDYWPWIIEHRVQVFLVDQRLDEGPGENGENVTYRGHSVVKALRQRSKEFPIFFLTGFPDDEDVQSEAGAVEEIIPRRALGGSNGKVHVERMVRRGTTYLNQHERELSELAELAKAAATGKIKGSDQRRLQAIQAKLNVEYSDTSEFDELLTSMSKELRLLSEVRSQFQAELELGKKKAKPNKGGGFRVQKSGTKKDSIQFDKLLDETGPLTLENAASPEPVDDADDETDGNVVSGESE